MNPFFCFFAFHVHTGKSIYHLTLLYLNILVNGWNFPKRFRKEIHVRQVAHSIWQNEFIRESRKSLENLS